MHTDIHANGLPPEPEKATLEGKNKFLGFWFFLAGETALFATLFGTFIGLRNQTANGPIPKDLFHLEVVALTTFILLVSSLTSVLAILAMRAENHKRMIFWFAVTTLLGYTFLGIEIYEFVIYVGAGLGFTTSAFSSAFYTLVGFHGAHVAFGATWILVLILKYWNRGITLTNAPKFYLASLYWHFIDVVWVFVFTVVYLMGVL